MNSKSQKYQEYMQIVREQLVPAMGCTEPVAIAYAASLATDLLGCLPERVSVSASANVIKNANSVVVPNTGGRRGIKAACAAGIVAGKPEAELQVIAEVTTEQQTEIEEFLKRDVIDVHLRETEHPLYIEVDTKGCGHTATVRIADYHTNVVLLKKDNQVVSGSDSDGLCSESNHHNAHLSIAEIYDFSTTCDYGEIKDLLDRQICCNTTIVQEGLSRKWGSAVGKTLLDTYGEQDVKIRAKAYAAAGSDARMSGSELPVVINSGSGNQGITVSIPVIEYARELRVSDEKLYRSLILSNLVAIQQKELIGCLSAFCGAVTAAGASAAGIAYLHGGNLDLINQTIINTLAVLPGMICDGAKPSCAAKIAASVDAAIMGFHLARSGNRFCEGEGIVKDDVEKTIQGIGLLGHEGMKETDKTVLRIMMDAEPGGPRDG